VIGPIFPILPHPYYSNHNLLVIYAGCPGELRFSGSPSWLLIVCNVAVLPLKLRPCGSSDLRFFLSFNLPLEGPFPTSPSFCLGRPLRQDTGPPVHVLFPFPPLPSWPDHSFFSPFGLAIWTVLSQLYPSFATFLWSHFVTSYS